jgi:hypothetical protein
MGNAGTSGYARIQWTHSPREGFVLVLLTEFKRAIAAERRLSDLRYMDRAALAREGISRADVPRRIFEEYYENDISYFPTHRAFRREKDRLTYCRKFQQHVIDLAWRRGPLAAN